MAELCSESALEYAVTRHTQSCQVQFIYQQRNDEVDPVYYSSIKRNTSQLTLDRLDG